mgnify:CR=1 FL=1|jgi:hypothetical protein
MYLPTQHYLKYMDQWFRKLNRMGMVEVVEIIRIMVMMKLRFNKNHQKCCMIMQISRDP